MRRSTILSGGCAALALCAGQASAQVQAIALTGAAYQSGPLGPGLGAEPFNGFSSGFSISNGRVIFSGSSTTVTGGGDNSGLWLWQGAGNALQIKLSDTPLGGAGAYTGGFLQQKISSSGAFSFRDGTSGTSGVYSTAGTPGKLFAVGQSVPVAGASVNPTVVSWNSATAFNAMGQTAVIGTITGGTPAVVTATGVTQDSTGIWAGTTGALSLLVRQNDPTTDTGARVGSITGSALGTGFSFNNNGKVLFTNILQGAAPDVITGSGATANSRVLLTTRNGALETVARQARAFPDANGVPVAGVPATDAAIYNSMSTGASGSCMNDNGRLVFTSTLRTAAGTTPTTNGTNAIFSDHRDGTLRTLARHTQTLPASTGLDTMQWGSTFTTPLINGANTVVFSNGGMTGTDPNTGMAVTSSANSGLFKSDSTGAITKIFRASDAAPAYSAAPGNPALGQSAGTVLFNSSGSDIVMNAAGQMAFIANLTGTGITQGGIGNNLGLFAVDTDGTIMLVAQKAMNFEVAPGDVRVVQGIQLAGSSGGQDGRAYSLDDDGNLVFRLGLWNSFPFWDPSTGNPPPGADASGLFVFHIPAPGSAGVLALGGLVAARRRRR